MMHLHSYCRIAARRTGGNSRHLWLYLLSFYVYSQYSHTFQDHDPREAEILRYNTTLLMRRRDPSLAVDGIFATCFRSP